MAQNSGDQANEDTILRRGHTNIMGQSQIRVEFLLGGGEAGRCRGNAAMTTRDGVHTE